MKVLIAGGGIGGLTAALCCLRREMDVEVFERSPAIAEVGAGIQISPNAMRVFQSLGLGQKIQQAGFLPERLETRMGQSGRVLFSIPAQSWDAPYVHIHRADLIEILQAAATEHRSFKLHLDAEVTGYAQGLKAALHLSDGRSFKGDYLIGADGIHSKIREQMIGPDAPEFTGNVAWRATVPTKLLGDLAPAPNATVWMGDQRHAVTYRLRGGELTNFVGVVERGDWQKESWTEPGELKALKADFADWHPVISNLINHVASDDLYRWALFDRAPLCEWTDGRVALLGDSAHAMLPFMAQGAAMAIEDSFVLAREISREISNTDEPSPQALKTYQAARYQRCSRVQYISRLNMKTFHRAAGIGKLSYLPMWLGGRLTPGLIKRRFDWIYGADA